ncbi:hypothetical protein EG329_000674, partial [Mollisiaceae sp. DMI_Dod_QoI]
MFNIHIKSTILFCILSTLITFSLAYYPVDGDTYEISCAKIAWGGECALRVTTFGDALIGFDGGRYNAVYDVFDHACNKLGYGYGALGTHTSVDSELRWTVEVDLPGSWDDSSDFSAWYSDYHMGGPGNCVVYGP